MIPKIESLMSENIIAIDSEKSVQEAAEAMSQDKVGSLLVSEGGTFVGIITEVDIIRKVVARQRPPETVTVKAVMTSPLVSIGANQSILEANELMEAKQVRHLVVKRSDQVVGVVSVRDFLHPIDIEEEGEENFEHVVGL